MIKVIQADHTNPEHGQAIVMLLDAYARDPMGGGKGLDEKAKENLIPALQQLSGSGSNL